MNMCFTTAPSNVFWLMISAVFPSLLVEKEHVARIYPVGHHLSHIMEESGYMHIQATKPDTIGICLNTCSVLWRVPRSMNSFIYIHTYKFL